MVLAPSPQGRARRVGSAHGGSLGAGRSTAGVLTKGPWAFGALGSAGEVTPPGSQGWGEGADAELRHLPIGVMDLGLRMDLFV